MKNLPKVGFHESVVPQVFDGKISTWRLRDHKLKKGDIVAFENSQTEEIFGFGKITKVIITTVGQIDLKDTTHYKTYKNRRELIKAFKRHYSTYKINNNTPFLPTRINSRRNLTKTGSNVVQDPQQIRVRFERPRDLIVKLI